MKGKDPGEETGGLTLIDNINESNKISRLKMIWTVRNCWTMGARFALNFYFREALLVVRWPAALCDIMTRREGVTKGDPLSVALYGLAFLSLTKATRAEDPGGLHPWYADEAAMRVLDQRNAKLLRALTEKIPYHRYSLEPEKSWNTCQAGKEENEVRAAFESEGIKVRYT